MQDKIVANSKGNKRSESKRCLEEIRGSCPALEPTGAGNAADNAEKLGLFNTGDKD